MTLAKKHKKKEDLFDKDFSEMKNGEEIKRFWGSFTEGKNIFLTGGAGTGKSYLIRELRKRVKGSKRSFCLTASTGIAAQNIGGTTVFKWGGIGIGPKEGQSFANFEASMKKKSYLYEKLCKRLAQAEILIIDEISMLSLKIFDFLNFHLKEVRGINLPFGGIQVIVVGDFLQLEPVVKNRYEEVRFCFESETWKEAEFEVINLKEVVRQDDENFVSLLNRVRVGEMSEEDQEVILSRRKRNVDESVTRIFAVNEYTEEWNEAMLNKLSGEQKIYMAETNGKEEQREALLKNMITPEVLVLKEGAKVMVTANDFNEEYYNGQIGFVQSLKDDIVEIELEGGKETLYISKNTWRYDPEDKKSASFEQIPLKLAYAITAHKSQGVTLKEAHVDLGRCFAHGQCYTALSRVTTLEGLTVESFYPNSVKAHEKAISFYEQLEK